MDAFYASVELLRYPRAERPAGGDRRRRAQRARRRSAQRRPRRFSRLRDYAGRGVVTTATYEARASGIRSGDGTDEGGAVGAGGGAAAGRFRAVRAVLAPVQGRRARDRPLHRGPRHRRNLHRSDRPSPGATAELAQRIKDRVREATGLSCSIGIAPNKLLAKIASDLDKPDGLTVLSENDVQTRIWPLPVRRINGIGPQRRGQARRAGHPDHRRTGGSRASSC
ncbi:MAG: hypothetical protein MZW92_78740 [Comamonadaceae bacterium]|nr:hypothetical protein [Comamonadaceae bacterium]